jgi:hypothetical protein
MQMKIRCIFGTNDEPIMCIYAIKVSILKVSVEVFMKENESSRINTI